jgi:hypothetical protein
MQTEIGNIKSVQQKQAQTLQTESAIENTENVAKKFLV